MVASPASPPKVAWSTKPARPTGTTTNATPRVMAAPGLTKAQQVQKRRRTYGYRDMVLGGVLMVAGALVAMAAIPIGLDGNVRTLGGSGLLFCGLCYLVWGVVQVARANRP